MAEFHIKGHHWGMPYNIDWIRCEDDSMIIRVPPDIHNKIMENHIRRGDHDYFLEDYLRDILKIFDEGRKKNHDEIRRRLRKKMWMQ